MKRARWLCSLSSVRSSSGRTVLRLFFTSLAHSATGMGLSVIATSKATGHECCTSWGGSLSVCHTPQTQSPAYHTGSGSLEASDLFKVTWLAGSPGTSVSSVSHGSKNKWNGDLQGAGGKVGWMQKYAKGKQPEAGGWPRKRQQGWFGEPCASKKPQRSIHHMLQPSRDHLYLLDIPGTAQTPGSLDIMYP